MVEDTADNGDEISVNDMVRFVDVHHMMNGGLKGHEGDLGIVTGTDMGHDDKAQVRFCEGSSKKVIDKWRIKPSRLEIVNGEGPWEFKCGMCGETYQDDTYGECPGCGRNHTGRLQS